MEELELTFLFQVNMSLSLGDIVYYQRDGVDTRLGSVTSISDDKTTINVLRPLTTEAPQSSDYVWFSKDSQVETSGIIGYEAMTTIVSDSTKKEELFAVSSEVFESSK